MTSFGEHLENVQAFVTEYQSLIDCHLVDFITENLWEKCLGEALRAELESMEYNDCQRGSHEHFRRMTLDCLELRDLMTRADSLCLKNCQSLSRANVLEIFETVEPETTERKTKNSVNFMTDKKQYEVAKLAHLVKGIAEMCKTDLVIDAGAGKGYLSTTLSEISQCPMLAVDSSKAHRKSAIRRQEMINKKKHLKRYYAETCFVSFWRPGLMEKSLFTIRFDPGLGPFQLFQILYSVQHIDEKTDYMQLIQSHCPDWSANSNFLLTGLHTCGQLAHSMMHSFLAADCIKSLCVVPCCYHLTEETLTGEFELSKNARMLAQQSVERIALREAEPHPPSLFYRAVLQIILQSLGIPKTRIGRGAPTQDFPSYVYWALTKIGVDSDKIPSKESLIQLYEAHLTSRWKFNIFQSIRVYLGSVVEATIVLDRVMFLEKSGRCSGVILKQLFDPLISPRCYAIVALKTNTIPTS